MAKEKNIIYPKVLVITRNAWNNNNSTGSTLSNLLDGWPESKIANVYCREEIINNSICNKYFKITENQIIKALKKHEKAIGCSVNYVQVEPISEEIYQNNKKVYGWFSRHRLTFFLWMRDILWKTASNKLSALDEFVEDFKPDVIYMHYYDSVYMLKLFKHISMKSNANTALFACDDTYTLKQFSLSPLFWINRFYYRKSTKNIAKECDTLFVISDKQKAEYDKIFKRDCVLLRKGGNFSKGFMPKESISTPVKLVYAGNIHSGRWKTLAELVKAIKKVNEQEAKVELDIYTLTPRTEEIIACLDVEGASKLMPPATDQKVSEAIHVADALIFVEPFQLKEKLKWRLSFSTKIVDYLASSRAIIAIGPQGLTSMDYLQSIDAAMCVNSQEGIYTCIRQIADAPEILIDYAKKTWECGSKNNDISEMKRIFLEHLQIQQLTMRSNIL